MEGGATGHSVKGYIYVDTRKTKKKEERDNIVVLLRKGTSSSPSEHTLVILYLKFEFVCR